MDVSNSPLAHLDHSLLAPTVTREELRNACEDARVLGFASVCLLPYFVGEAAALLRGSDVRVSTVIAFPHGAESLSGKLALAEAALDAGAEELDVVGNVSLLLSGDRSAVEEEIRALTERIHERGGRVKWIFENAHLDREKKLFLCDACSAAGVDWVKTSTGFAASGATLDDVRLMRERCPSSIEVKASGGIRTLAEVEAFLAAGASRIGTSRTVQIAREWRERGS